MHDVEDRSRILDDIGAHFEPEGVSHVVPDPKQRLARGERSEPRVVAVEGHPRCAVERDFGRRVECYDPPLAGRRHDVVAAGRGTRKQHDRRGDRGRDRSADQAKPPAAPRRRLRLLVEVVRGFADDDVRQQGIDRLIGRFDRIISLGMARIFGEPLGECLPRRIVAVAQPDVPLDRARADAVL